MTNLNTWNCTVLGEAYCKDQFNPILPSDVFNHFEQATKWLCSQRRWSWYWWRPWLPAQQPTGHATCLCELQQCPCPLGVRLGCSGGGLGKQWERAT